MNPLLIDNLSPTLQGKRILLGISGSIAAFKACDIIRGLRQAGAEVRVVLTDSAQRFVTPVTLETLSGHPVFTSLWNDGGQGTHHIDAARWADLALVAPATANTLAKLAWGMADDLLSTELLAFRGPLLIAPAMNPAMFEHPATQANLRTLQDRGARICRILGPASGLTSCGEEGPGRMLEPEEIIEAVAQSLLPPPRQKKVLITLGPTRSAIDPVRYLTNRSSGLMGASLAWAAWRSGYEVTCVAGPTDAPLPRAATVYRVQTAHQMLEACQKEFPTSDVFIASAAVLDWDVANPAAQKLKKDAGPAELRFVANPDILATLAASKRPDQFVLGFAAETQAVVEAGQKKLLQKRCDALFSNDVSGQEQGFESLLNGGWWITAQETRHLPARRKSRLAQDLIELIERQERNPSP